MKLLAISTATALLFGLAAFPESSQATELPRVALVTGFGEIVVEVDTVRAPITGTNFLRYVDAGHYDGASFYRTVTHANDNGAPKIQVIQGGRGSESEPVFPPIEHESTEITGIRHADGTISMSRNGAGTAASEIFICIGDQPGLDFGASRNADGLGFAAFGRVVEGMETVKAIHRLPSGGATNEAYVTGQIIEQPAVISRAARQP